MTRRTTLTGASSKRPAAKAALATVPLVVAAVVVEEKAESSGLHPLHQYRASRVTGSCLSRECVDQG